MNHLVWKCFSNLPSTCFLSKIVNYLLYDPWMQNWSTRSHVNSMTSWNSWDHLTSGYGFTLQIVHVRCHLPSIMYFINLGPYFMSKHLVDLSHCNAKSISIINISQCKQIHPFTYIWYLCVIFYLILVFFCFVLVGF
jgi:hypothetical protein